MADINQRDSNGKKTGYWEENHDNGNLWSKGNFINGRLAGYWEEYNSNGNMKSKEFYI